MRTRNAIERLAAVAPSAPLVDSGDEERILQQILGYGRPTARGRRPIVLAVVAAVVIGVALAAVATHWRATPAERSNGGSHHVQLTGARIQLAGYHFKTPAGFKPSDASCGTPASGAAPDGFAAAASAQGGCIEAAYLAMQASTVPVGVQVVPDGAQPVDVGSDQGYYVSPDENGKSALYVELAQEATLTYLVLFAQGLTEDQLVAVAESGLTPFGLQ